MSKNLIFRLKMAKNWPFLAKNGQTRIFFKNPLGTFFQPRQDANLYQISEKSDALISRYRVTHGRTHRRTSANPQVLRLMPRDQQTHTRIEKRQIFAIFCHFQPKNQVFGHFLRIHTTDLSKTWSETWDNCFESSNGSVVSRKILVLAVLAIFGSKIHCLW